MKISLSIRTIAAIASFAGISACLGEVTVGIGHSATGTAFNLSPTPRPATNDAATAAVFTLVDGQRDRNGAELSALHDGRVPWDADEPSKNFFSEVDVIESNGPAPVPAPERSLSTHESGDGAFKISVDASLAPDLREWVEKELMPVVCDWYPKLVSMLPSKGYTAPAAVVIEFRDDMGGTPAYAAGNKVSLNAQWFRQQLKGEAKGCVIHELVHVVQNYGRARATNPRATQTPGWVVEGMADYIRWFLFEPQLKGAEITRGNFQRSNHDSSYRVSANFLNWVVATHDKNFIQKLNAAAREGDYSEKIWTDSTGKTAAQLGEDWKAANAKRLGL
jgi:hypothetical protein